MLIALPLYYDPEKQMRQTRDYPWPLTSSMLHFMKTEVKPSLFTVSM